MERLVTTAEFAARLRVHPKTLLKMERRGEAPPALRMGRKMLRWTEDDVAKAVAEWRRRAEGRRDRDRGTSVTE